MSFFKKLFGKKDKSVEVDEGPTNSERLESLKAIDSQTTVNEEFPLAEGDVSDELIESVEKEGPVQQNLDKLLHNEQPESADPTLYEDGETSEDVVEENFRNSNLEKEFAELKELVGQLNLQKEKTVVIDIDVNAAKNMLIDEVEAGVKLTTDSLLPFRPDSTVEGLMLLQNSLPAPAKERLELEQPIAEQVEVEELVEETTVEEVVEEEFVEEIQEEPIQDVNVVVDLIEEEQLEQEPIEDIQEGVQENIEEDIQGDIDEDSDEDSDEDVDEDVELVVLHEDDGFVVTAHVYKDKDVLVLHKETNEVHTYSLYDKVEVDGPDVIKVDGSLYKLGEDYSKVDLLVFLSSFAGVEKSEGSLGVDNEYVLPKE